MMCYNTEQQKAYFERIGLPYPEKIVPDFELFCRIQYAQCTTIPYENLDIIRHIPISLSEEDLFEKIIIRKRGGYCFELNGILGALLRSLGYQVTDCFARYLRGEKTIPMRRHRMLKVETPEGTYTCDAGTGEACPRTPLRLVQGIVQDSCGEKYRYEKNPSLGWILMDCLHGEWEPFYSFEEFQILPVDFTAVNYYCQYAPESPFNKQEMFSLKTDDGRITLDGRIFKRIRNEKVTEVIEYTADRMQQAYEAFGLSQE